MISTRTHPSAVLFCAAVCLACASPIHADFDLMTAIAVWHMDEGEGDVIKDSSPKNNHAQLFRGPLWVDGRYGKALQFDGKSFAWAKKAVDIPVGTAPRTVMCHFKWAQVNDWADAQVGVSDGEVLVSLGVAGWHGRLSLGIYTEGGPGVDTVPARRLFKWAGDTDWHHLAAVFPDGATKANEFVLYLDGVLQDSSFSAGPNAEQAHLMESRGEQATIATMCSAITHFFRGTIDEAAVFPFAMAAEDVASVARKGLVRGQFLDVSPNGKLATSWATLKAL